LLPPEAYPGHPELLERAAGLIASAGEGTLARIVRVWSSLSLSTRSELRYVAGMSMPPDLDEPEGEGEDS